MAAGKKHGNGANTKRSERRKNRYHENLRMRVNALEKLQKQGVEVDTHQLQKLQRMLDKPRKRAVSRRRTVHQRRNKWAQMRSDLGGAFGKHTYSEAAYICKDLMERS